MIGSTKTSQDQLVPVWALLLLRIAFASHYSPVLPARAFRGGFPKGYSLRHDKGPSGHLASQPPLGVSITRYRAPTLAASAYWRRLCAWLVLSAVISLVSVNHL